MKDIERDAFVAYVHCFSLCILLGQNKDLCILFIYNKHCTLSLCIILGIKRYPCALIMMIEMTW